MSFSGKVVSITSRRGGKRSGALKPAYGMKRSFSGVDIALEVGDFVSYDVKDGAVINVKPLKPTKTLIERFGPTRKYRTSFEARYAKRMRRIA